MSDHGGHLDYDHVDDGDRGGHGDDDEFVPPPAVFPFDPSPDPSPPQAGNPAQLEAPPQHHLLAPHPALIQSPPTSHPAQATTATTADTASAVGMLVTRPALHSALVEAGLERSDAILVVATVFEDIPSGDSE